MTGKALLLAPGAGHDSAHHVLVAVAEAVGLPNQRMDFPYRKAGRQAPDPPKVAVRAVVEEAEQLIARGGVEPAGLILGGRSYGGRMCSLAVAQGLPAAGLVLLSYPLHPPGRPEQIRTEHFPDITVPCLFISGSSDPFGSPQEFAAAFPLLKGKVSQIWVPGAHDPLRHDEAIAKAVSDWARDLD